MLRSRSGRSVNWSWFAWLLSIFLLSILISATQVFAESKGQKKRQNRAARATPSPSPGEQNLTYIPLPIGHEAKGLVLPDFDDEGLGGRKLDASTARRIEQGRVGLQQLKITTYTP